MIIFGTLKAWRGLHGDHIACNLNVPFSLGLGVVDVSCLTPIVPMGMYVDEYDYDCYLAQNIISNDYVFDTLMTNIMWPDYCGENVYVIVSEVEALVPYVESLLKFIQDRYGFMPNWVNEPEDIPLCRPTEFSIEGRQQFQADKERFVYLHINDMMEQQGDEADEY